jgi:hypothetical protein
VYSTRAVPESGVVRWAVAGPDLHEKDDGGHESHAEARYRRLNDPWGLSDERSTPNAESNERPSRRLREASSFCEAACQPAIDHPSYRQANGRSGRIAQDERRGRRAGISRDEPVRTAPPRSTRPRLRPTPWGRVSFGYCCESASGGGSPSTCRSSHGRVHTSVAGCPIGDGEPISERLGDSKNR